MCSVQVYSYIHCGTSRAISSCESCKTAAVVAMVCRQWYTLSLNKPHRPRCHALRVRGCSRAMKGNIMRHSGKSLLHSLPVQLHPISLFPFQCSIARAHGIHRGVHRCGALSIELLQRQIALVLHYSSLLEVCDLCRSQHSSPIIRIAPLLSIPIPVYSPNYSRMRSQIL